MVYTNSIRMSVCRRIIREKLGVDDLAFEALCEQEVAKRKDEQEKAQKKAQEEAKRVALEAAAEEAKLQGVPEDQDDKTVAAIETREFGGDFGEEQTPDVGEPAGDGESESGDDGEADVDSEAGDSAPSGEAAEDDEGAVGGAGQDPAGVQQLDGSGEEGQLADPV